MLRSVGAVGEPVAGHPEALWLVPLALMTAAIFGIAELAALPFGFSPGSMLAGYGYKALRVFPAVIAVTVFAQLLLALRKSPDAPLAAFLEPYRRLASDPWLIAARALPLLLTPVVFVSFSSLKMLIPRFLPFWLDDSFAAADRALFLGHQPWELTHALFGSAAATIFFDRLYSFWVLLLSIVIVSMALFARRADRARFFLSFTLIWILLGVVGAWLGASAGPCYTQAIGASSAPEFAGLMQRLHDIGDGGVLGALDWQDMLWRSYANQDYQFGMGISAMPSLHNAIALLYALAAFRIARPLGYLFSLYGILIYIGSIHLGWHYAVDGIVSAAGAAAIWVWVDRWCSRSGYDRAVAGDRKPGLSEETAPAFA